MHLHLVHLRTGEVLIGLALAGALAWLILRRPKPGAGERERARRENLAQTGRIIDGVLIDNMGLQPATAAGGNVLFYRYRVGGVTYESAQDVSQLSEQVRGLRVDRPIQVRYDAHNPADSIIVSESWNGVQSSAVHGRQG